MDQNRSQEIRLIPVENIRVINPRTRDKRKFRTITESIASVGLKKPITVSCRLEEPNSNEYNLVCGQGRLEAFKALGEKDIPARVVDISKEDCLIMSLVENLARKSHNHIELLRNIKILKDRGHSIGDIAKKTGLSSEYIHGMVILLEQGEERLILAVERRQIPITAALMIAKSEKEELQQALMEAYERNELRGKAIRHVRRLVEQRETFGKTIWSGPRSKHKKLSTVDALVKAYKKESERQQLMIKKAKLCETRLIFVVEGLKELMKDENFVNLLRAEQLNTMPKYLAEQMQR
jgi:ParB family chromosome partitioning protein